MEYVITIDIGTTKVRASAFDLSNNLLGARQGSYPTFHPQPDYSEQDPEQIFLTVLYALKGLINDELPKKHRPIAIVFGASMHSVLPIDKHGIPLRNAVIWADNRGRDEATYLKNSALGAAIYEQTGTPIHPMSPLIKIRWFGTNTSASWLEKVYKFISIKEYIIYQLTGQLVVDYSLASSTGLFNIHQLNWEPSALEFARIKPQQLSEPVSIDFDDLKLKKEYIRLFRLPTTIKVIAGASDGCLATLGAGVVSEGDATITIGSSGAVRVAGKQVLVDEKQRFFNYILSEGTYISGGPTNNGGVVFEWFVQQFGASGVNTDMEYAINQLLMQAERVPAGAGGLLFLPYLLGERAPLWNANARGAYLGVNITHERKHFIRATVEGIIYEVYSIGKLLQEYRSIENLYINGAFATLPLFAQVLSDVFGKTVYINDKHDSASAGAALLALTKLGKYENLEAASRTIKSVKTYSPDDSNHQRYNQFSEIFDRLSHKLADDFDALVSLQG